MNMRPFTIAAVALQRTFGNARCWFTA
jgi:hypothetical protein